MRAGLDLSIPTGRVAIQNRRGRMDGHRRARVATREKKSTNVRWRDVKVSSAIGSEDLRE